MALIDSLQTAITPFRTTVESTRQKMGLGLVEHLKTATGLTLHPLTKVASVRANMQTQRPGAAVQAPSAPMAGFLGTLAPRPPIYQVQPGQYSMAPPTVGYGGIVDRLQARAAAARAGPHLGDRLAGNVVQVPFVTRTRTGQAVTELQPPVATQGFRTIGYNR